MKQFLSALLLFVLMCGRLAAADAAASNAPAAGDSTNSGSAPSLGLMPTPDAIATPTVSESDRLKEYQVRLDLGKQQRLQKSLPLAAQTLSGILKDNAPTEIKRLALFELALVAQDSGEYVRSEQIFAQYVHTYPDDPSAPEVLLREGMIFRQMGVNTLAISKFYAVMSTALKLKLANMDYYKKIVLQAQVEIADTYYIDGKYDEAANFFTRLLKAGNADLNQGQIQYKLVRSLSYLTNYSDTAAQAQIYLELYTNTPEVPEVRFFFASALKKEEHNSDAMKQVLLLLQSQEENARKNPETWIYWQQRAGNDIANQLYKEGDYFNALQIYLSLADLDKSPAWQLPVWYQTALVYEQLQQWPKATAAYQRILDRQKELTETNSTPTLASLMDMAKWRRDYIDWMQKAKATQQSFVLTQATNNTHSATP